MTAPTPSAETARGALPAASLKGGDDTTGRLQRLEETCHQFLFWISAGAGVAVLYLILSSRFPPGLSARPIHDIARLIEPRP